MKTYNQILAIIVIIGLSSMLVVQSVSLKKWIDKADDQCETIEQLKSIVEDCVDIQQKGWEAFELSKQFSKYDQIMHVLKEVESDRNHKAVGDGGRAYGVLQIHKGCIDDVNRFYGTKFTHKQVFEEDMAEEVFYLYLEMGSIRYKIKHGKEATEEQLVRMWNGGIYAGYTNPNTEKYYKKYLVIKNRQDE